MAPPPLRRETGHGPSSTDRRDMTRHITISTPVGVIHVDVLHDREDGTFDVLCTCSGARWECRVRLPLETAEPVQVAS